jgi:hypothetical protein
LLHPKYYPPQHLSVTLFLSHPHPHSVSEHILMVALELGSEFFSQSELNYYFQQY